VAILAAHDARNLLTDACLSLGLTLEAMRAEMSAFDPRIQHGASACGSDQDGGGHPHFVEGLHPHHA
jgi:histidine ammonia-lyase